MMEKENTLKRVVTVKERPDGQWEYATLETGWFSWSKKEQAEKALTRRGYTCKFIPRNDKSGS